MGRSTRRAWFPRCRLRCLRPGSSVSEARARRQEFVRYLTRLQQKGGIKSFEAVFLDAYGGDLNGFFLIRADGAQLDQLVTSEEWLTHITRATFHPAGAGVVRAVTGDAVYERMNLWLKPIPV